MATNCTSPIVRASMLVAKLSCGQAAEAAYFFEVRDQRQNSHRHAQSICNFKQVITNLGNQGTCACGSRTDYV